MEVADEGGDNSGEDGCDAELGLSDQRDPGEESGDEQMGGTVRLEKADEERDCEQSEQAGMKGRERVRENEIAGGLEDTQPMNGKQRKTGCRRRQDAARESVEKSEDAGGGEDAVHVEEGERGTKGAVESGIEIRRERGVKEADIGIERFASGKAQRDVHVATTIDEGIAPALPGDPQGQNKNNEK